ncbi:hypothetical protein VTJ04DRAFT_2317 [Mycothermus thermophilus]|uniref:uncharacterized protein n=1 Tax=Humicola insolens TaxID=85995 RepID=UPI00374243BF
MGGFSMNRVLGTIKKRSTFGGGGGGGDAAAETTPADLSNGSPEAIAARCVKQFCHSAGASTGDDVVYLPSIVESAVASPVAAEECARLIRKYMTQDYWSKPSCQYNAVMLVRILADNPGEGFTRFIDKKFVDTTKELLRAGRDASVRQILMETLDAFETTKATDPGLAPLIAMWQKEKAKAFRAYGGAQAPVPAGFNPYSVPPPPAGPPPPTGFYPHHVPHHGSRHHRPRRLPDPVELANRLEEARTSAKLLEQVVGCTPASELLANELVHEFADRCNAASRSIQGYMNATDPAPDTNTMESLIDVNEQLQHALNLHRRAVLQARKLQDQANPQGQTQTPPQSQSQQQSRSSTSPDPSRPLSTAPPARKPVSVATGFGHGTTTNRPTNGGPSNGSEKQPRVVDTDSDDDDDNPFRDPPNLSNNNAQRLSFEPFHPGFTPASGSGSGSGSGFGRGATVVAAAAGTPSSGAAQQPRRPVTPSEDSMDDVYSATPKRETAPGGGLR